MKPSVPLSSSYRDPDGFVFVENGYIYRYIGPAYFENYELLFSSGLYYDLTEKGRLVKHEEITPEPGADYKIILPEQIPFISYPYEWSFDMWKDAAIVTLKIAILAQKKGMMLKDATPFNIQFNKGQPVFIDTLSFERYDPQKPWIAYRQFCECFLGPLLLMKYCHRDMAKFIRVYPEGIPLEIICNLLPARAFLNIYVQLHILIQRKISSRNKKNKASRFLFSHKKLQVLLGVLLDMLLNMKPKEKQSVWKNYYTETILGAGYLSAKEEIFKKISADIPFKSVIDLGANDGNFSMLLRDRAASIIATDGDSNCINMLYKNLKKEKIKNIVPLVSELTAPSPALGWANAERTSLTSRLKGDLILALALVHHLAIAGNVPLSFIAKWLSGMGPFLIIEFVPKSDEKVQQLLMHRKDIFPHYTHQEFKKEFGIYFTAISEERIGNTERILFLMKRNDRPA